MSENLVINLESCLDKNKNTYYIGKLKGPFTIDCKDGIAFIIFTSSEGSEELHVSALTPKKKEYSSKPEVYGNDQYYKDQK